MVEFPEETSIGYIKSPSSNKIEQSKRVLTYNIEELLNFEDYWWLPLEQETEFSLGLNLLPPFPKVNPVDMSIVCTPEVATGLQAGVTTTIKLEAEEQIDSVFLRLNAPHTIPGVSMALTEFSGDGVKDPRTSITVPSKQFPFPHVGLERGQAVEYKVTTSISSKPSNMTSLRCQQEILSTKLLLMSESKPDGPPCRVTVLDENNLEVPVLKTVRSTILQANAQVMYSPFSIQRDQMPQSRGPIISAAAQ